MNLDVIHCGDCLEVMKGLDAESVHCCVTSPPYWGLRDYGVDGQLGLEETPDEYVSKMVTVFREVRRVLRNDGTLWLNLGDSYAANRSYQVTDSKHTAVGNTMAATIPPSLKPKDLVGIPWRVAFALQADGWWLRQDIIWHKPNPMPESVTDRCTKAHEYVFLLSKSARYYYDAEAVKEASTGQTGASATFQRASKESLCPFQAHKQHRKERGDREDTGTRNKRSVWTVTTKSFSEAHFATFPPKLIEPCVLAGTSDHGACSKCGAPWGRDVEKERTFESGSGKSGRDPIGKNGPGFQGGGATGDIRRGPCVTSHTVGWRPSCECDAGEPVPCVVLDPFMGAGTTAVVSRKHNRHFIGCELNPEYIEIANKRIADICTLPLFDEQEASA